jgi:uncharacterized protein (DUF58 family)
MSERDQSSTDTARRSSALRRPLRRGIEAFRTRPAVRILVLWVFVSILALAGGWSLLFYLSWALLLLLGISYLLAFSGSRAFYFHRQTRTLRAEVGSYFDEKIVVENGSWIPKFWLEIEDRGQHPEHTASFVVSLGPYGRFVRPVHTLCRQRGVFQLGPVYAHSGDPFGLFRYQRQISGSSTLVVYPVALDLPAFGRLPGDLPGGGLQGERVQFSTPNVAGVRDYQPGDTYNRIHWPTTARQRRLMVKEFELDPFSDVWLILDLDSRTMVGSGPESTEEYAVTACASLAKYFLAENRAVGVVTQGQVLAADREMRQLLKVLELLAFVRPRPRPSLVELLLAEQQRFGRTDCLVVVTATTDDNWVRVGQTLGARGVRTSAVLVNAATFRPTPPRVRITPHGGGVVLPEDRAAPPLLLAGSTAAAGMPTYLLKQGYPLQQALAAPLIGPGGAYGRVG